MDLLSGVLVLFALLVLLAFAEISTAMSRRRTGGRRMSRLRAGAAVPPGERPRH